MFDFLDNDIFVITLEILFLLFIIYDFRKWLESKKREYLLNIAMAIGFFIYTAIPFYHKYYTWSDKNISMIKEKCISENNATLCECLTDMSIKEYSFSDYNNLDKEELDSFIVESKKECLED